MGAMSQPGLMARRTSKVRDIWNGHAGGGASSSIIQSGKYAPKADRITLARPKSNDVAGLSRPAPTSGGENDEEEEEEPSGQYYCESQRALYGNDPRFLLSAKKCAKFTESRKWMFGDGLAFEEGTATSAEGDMEMIVLRERADEYQESMGKFPHHQEIATIAA